MQCSLVKINQSFREHFISIFMVGEYTKQETSMKQAASRAVLDPEDIGDVFL
jgi:hypothetical protein